MTEVYFKVDKKNNNYFQENYQIVMNALEFENEQTIIIDDKNDTCRFCGKTSKEVSFSNKSHAVPEAFGNKKVITKNECDNCNQKYANSIENDLLKLTSPVRNMTTVHGKRGVPTYKDEKTGNRCEYIDGNYKIDDHKEFFELDEKNKQAILKFETQKMVPLKAYKALVRIALNCLPKEYFDKFKMIEWLENEEDLGPVTAFYTTVIVKFIPKISPMFNICLFIRKENRLNVPYCQMVLQSNNTFYQIIIPFRDEDRHLYKEKKVIIEPFSFGVEENLESTIDLIDLASNEKTTTTVDITIKYEQRELEE